MDDYLVKPGTKVDLAEWPADDHESYDGGKKNANKEMEELTSQLEELQELMYAENRQKLLVVLQGMDTSGKDGTIRRVFEGVNPQGVKVASFKVPTSQELAHDYLWRVHQHTPGSGEIAIFNRSHYEDVLVVRVHNLVPKKVWSKRYDHINDFEHILADEGTTILKFFLHISKEEQREQLQERLDTPHKRWKFNPADLDERLLWADYMAAYEEMLSRTSTDYAPWYVVPSNRRWHRDVVIGRILVKTLKDMKMSYPEPDFDYREITVT
jgi:PPK2 family polyphosphate:nucleotide phosphotransferase